MNAEEALKILIATQAELFYSSDDKHQESGRGVINAYKAVSSILGEEVVTEDVSEKTETEEDLHSAAEEGVVNDEKANDEEIQQAEEKAVTQEGEFTELRTEFSDCVNASFGDQIKKAECNLALLAGQKEEQIGKTTDEEQTDIKTLDQEVLAVKEIMNSLSPDIKSQLEPLIAEIEKYVFVDKNIMAIKNELEKVKQVSSDSAKIKLEITSLGNVSKEAMNASLQIKFQKGMVPFKDVDDNQWYFTYIADLKKLGCVSGYKDASGNDSGEFRPFNSVTVAEGLKIILECAKYNEEDTLAVTVVNKAKGHWAEKYFNKATELNLSLVLNSEEDPNRLLKREEVVTLIFEAFKKDPASNIDYFFTDLDRNAKSTVSIESARIFGIVSGDAGAQTFRPNDTIMRSELSKMVLQGMGVGKL